MADLKISALTASTTPLAGTEVLPIVQSSTTKQVSVANLTAGRAVSALSYEATQYLGTSLGSGGVYLSGDGSPDLGFVGYNYKNVSGTETVPAPARASWRHGFGNGGTVAWLVSYRAPAAAAGAWTNMFRVESTGNALIDNGNLVPGTAAKGINFTANTPAAGVTSQLLNWYEEGTWTPTTVGVITNSGTPIWTGRYTRIGRQVTVQFSMSGGSITLTAFSHINNLPFSAAVSAVGGYVDEGNALLPGTCYTSGSICIFVTLNTYAAYFAGSVVYTI